LSLLNFNLESRIFFSAKKVKFFSGPVSPGQYTVSEVRFIIHPGTSQAHPQFCMRPWARRGERFLRTPSPAFGGTPWSRRASTEVPRQAFDPAFLCGKAWMDPKESFPAGIPHPSPSPPGNHGDGKLGVGGRHFLLDKNRFFYLRWGVHEALKKPVQGGRGDGERGQKSPTK
jgi:hypothetical protein